MSLPSPKRYRLDRSPAEFRAGLSALKKAGIIDVDIRRAKPDWVRAAGPKGGRYTLTELLNKYDNIVSGKATAVSVKPEVAREFGKLQYERTRQGRVIIPHAATEKVSVTPTGKIKIQHPTGITRTPVPVEYRNLPQYFKELKANQKELKKGKAKGRYFAFHFFGGHSALYSDIDLLLDDLEHYETVNTAISKKDARAMNEIYRNLEIVETTKGSWSRSKETTKRKSKKTRPKTGGTRKATLARLKQGPGWKLDEYRKKRAAAARKYRAAMSPARKKEESRKAMERAKRRGK